VKPLARRGAEVADVRVALAGVVERLSLLRHPREQLCAGRPGSPVRRPALRRGPETKSRIIYLAWSLSSVENCLAMTVVLHRQGLSAASQTVTEPMSYRSLGRLRSSDERGQRQAVLILLDGCHIGPTQKYFLSRAIRAVTWILLSSQGYTYGGSRSADAAA